MVFQSYAVWPHLTVFDNIALPLREGAQRVDRHEVERRAIRRWSWWNWKCLRNDRPRC
jgi:iron(III) transport system ATP-binding protein